MGFFIYLCTMKKEKMDYWSNVGCKPKGFSFVKGELMTYTYEVPVLWTGQKTVVIDRIFIKMKMKYDAANKRTNIDIPKTKELIAKEMGSEQFYFDDDGLFLRDRSLFPYVNNITLFNSAPTDDTTKKTSFLCCPSGCYVLSRFSL